MTKSYCKCTQERHALSPSSVLTKEQEKLKAELQEVKEVSVIFEWTARLGEALAIVVRYI